MQGMLGVADRQHSRPREKPKGDWHDPDARTGLLAEVARDAVRALRAVEEDEDLATDAAAGLLRGIVGQEFEVEDDNVPRPRRGRRTRRIVSAHDPELRHGRQTAARPSPATRSTRRRQPRRRS
jgi:hypothetical protein